MKITKKLRNQIYKGMLCECRTQVSLCFGYFDSCLTIYSKTKAEDLHRTLVSSKYPELLLFKPLSLNPYYLDDTDRILVLGFMIAMTE